MPSPAAHTAADRLDLGTGIVHRTCRVCSIERPLNAENFFHRVDRSTGEVSWVDARCQTCRRRRDAETRAARRAGSPVRATRFGRKFGIEIECLVDRHAIQRELTARGIRHSTPGYTHRVSTSWKIVTDASVSGGYELVSPPLSGPAGIEQLRKVCEALDAAGARVDRRCGLHVHHDVSDLGAGDFGRLLRSWSGAQAATDQLVAPSRRNSQWAMPLRESNIEVIEGAQTVASIRSYAARTNRYHSLNVNCFPRYGTVEVRQHQGTCSFDKIVAWLAFGQAMITRAKSGGDLMVPADAPALLDELANHGLAAAQVTFLKGRAAHFARPARRRAAV